METKREIRRRIRQKRQELDETIRCGFNERITASVVSHPWFLEAEDIYTYVDYDGEAGTRKIIGTAFDQGKNVWVPKVAGDTMHFYRIGSLAVLKPGAYGILEPADCSSEQSHNMAEGNRTRLMLMPGVAFDGQCHRIGYGGGYYDRHLAGSLAKGVKFRTMALAFEFQILPAVPYEEYDILPEIVVTDRRMIIHF